MLLGRLYDTIYNCIGGIAALFHGAGLSGKLGALLLDLFFEGHGLVAGVEWNGLDSTGLAFLCWGNF